MKKYLTLLIFVLVFLVSGCIPEQESYCDPPQTIYENTILPKEEGGKVFVLQKKDENYVYWELNKNKELHFGSIPAESVIIKESKEGEKEVKVRYLVAYNDCSVPKEVISTSRVIDHLSWEWYEITIPNWEKYQTSFSGIEQIR